MISRETLRNPGDPARFEKIQDIVQDYKNCEMEQLLIFLELERGYIRLEREKIYQQFVEQGERPPVPEGRFERPHERLNATIRFMRERRLWESRERINYSVRKKLEELDIIAKSVESTMQSCVKGRRDSRGLNFPGLHDVCYRLDIMLIADASGINGRLKFQEFSFEFRDGLYLFPAGTIEATYDKAEISPPVIVEPYSHPCLIEFGKPYQKIQMEEHSLKGTPQERLLETLKLAHHAIRYRFDDEKVAYHSLEELCENGAFKPIEYKRCSLLKAYQELRRRRFKA